MTQNCRWRYSMNKEGITLQFQNYLDIVEVCGDPIQIAPGVGSLNLKQLLVVFRQRVDESDHRLQSVAEIPGSTMSGRLLNAVAMILNDVMMWNWRGNENSAFISI